MTARSKASISKRTRAAFSAVTLPPLLYVSKVSAGFPAPGDDMVEKRLSLDDFLITHPASTFFVRAAGTSMEGAHIVTDDVLVVDRSAEPVHGAIVVAALAGELVVKRIRKKGAALALVSENPTYAPIPITEESDCVVWGVVIGVVRKL